MPSAVPATAVRSRCFGESLNSALLNVERVTLVPQSIKTSHVPQQLLSPGPGLRRVWDLAVSNAAPCVAEQWPPTVLRFTSGRDHNTVLYGTRSDTQTAAASSAAEPHTMH